jgi:hypothetical protein
MMKKLAILAILSLLIAPVAAEANLLQNSGFEDSDTGGWTDEWGNNIHAVTDNPHSGTYAARNFMDGGMYQDVSITGEVDYKLTGWAYIPEGGSGNWGTYIGLQYLNSGGGIVGSQQIDMQSLTRDVYNQADTGWLTAPEAAVTARVRFGTWGYNPAEGILPANPTNFDDFNLQAVPEPSSLILLGTGLAGLLGFGARKKRNKS